MTLKQLFFFLLNNREVLVFFIIILMRIVRSVILRTSYTYSNTDLKTAMIITRLTTGLLNHGRTIFSHGIPMHVIISSYCCYTREVFLSCLFMFHEQLRVENIYRSLQPSTPASCRLMVLPVDAVLIFISLIQQLLYLCFRLN